MNPFELLKALFSKSKPEVRDIQIVNLITINKWLSLMDFKVAKIASDLLEYLFYVRPEHYYYLLYFHLPKGSFKFQKLPTTTETKESLLLNKVQYILGWSDREMRLNHHIFKETILKEANEWCQRLGVQI